MIVDRPFSHIQGKGSKIPFNESNAERLLLAESGPTASRTSQQFMIQPPVHSR